MGWTRITEKFRLVAELAWAGLCESGRPVLHESADPGALRPKPEEVRP